MRAFFLRSPIWVALLFLVCSHAIHAQTGCAAELQSAMVTDTYGNSLEIDVAIDFADYPNVSYALIDGEVWVVTFFLCEFDGPPCNVMDVYPTLPDGSQGSYMATPSSWIGLEVRFFDTFANAQDCLINGGFPDADGDGIEDVLDNCSDLTACNYNDPANVPCVLSGCTDPLACNYDATAGCDNGTCNLPDGCTDPLACNFNPLALCDDGSCDLSAGCMDEDACNYTANANCDNGLCTYPAEVWLDCDGSCLADHDNNGICDVTFTGALSSDWNTPGNWNLGFVPTYELQHQAIIPAGLTVEVAPGTGLAFYLENHGTLVYTGFNAQVETLYNTGTIHILDNPEGGGSYMVVQHLFNTGGVFIIDEEGLLNVEVLLQNSGRFYVQFNGVIETGTVQNDPNGIMYIIGDVEQGYWQNDGEIRWCQLGNVSPAVTEGNSWIAVCPDDEEVCDGEDSNWDGQIDEFCGCTNPLACNFDPTALTDNGSCDVSSGCLDELACNYNPAVCLSDPMLCFYAGGCTNVSACNYDEMACSDDGSCEYFTCRGCVAPSACNYDPSASIDDGSCEFDSCAGCTYPDAPNYDPSATRDDGSCAVGTGLSCPEDLNGDGLLGTGDILQILGVMGTTCPE